MVRSLVHHMGLMGCTLVLVVGASASLMAPPALACPAETEHARGLEPHASQLPDCRAYEQVSPVDKNGVDAGGGVEAVQAAPTGDAVTFFAISPLHDGEGAHEVGTSSPQLSLRLKEDAWLTQGLLPPTSVGSEAEIAGYSEDLTSTILVSGEPALAPGAATGPGVRNAYVRDNATGAYQLLAANIGGPRLFFVDATPARAAPGGRRILFETESQLPTSNGSPVPGVLNLYEWDESKPPAERVRLADLVPPHGESSCGPAGPSCEPPAQGAVAGAGGLAVSPQPGGGSVHFDTNHTIAEDGSSVYFTDLETGVIYLRKPSAQVTTQVSAGTEPAYWRDTTPSGSFVFYTEGNKLYRFSAATGKSEAITNGGEGTGVLGTLGVSDDGAYAYFASLEVLAANERSTGTEVEKAEPGQNNLYEWHSGTITYIATLDSTDTTNWQAFFEAAAVNNGEAGAGEKTARVSRDGREVLFSSVRSLTGYNNGTSCNEGANVRPCFELYVYHAGMSPSARNPVCISCDARSARATWDADLALKNTARTVEPPTRSVILTHNLSDNGARVFFNSKEPLLPGDSNGRENVYEWEHEGSGSCTSTSGGFQPSSGGCLYLISTGTGGGDAEFGDADAEGENIFFFTREQLVGQDQDENEDLYDARVDGGIVAQSPRPSVPCAEEATCRREQESAPAFPAPASALLSGVGNLSPMPPTISTSSKQVKCPKGRGLRHGQCVKIVTRHKRKRTGRARSRARKAGERKGVHR